MKLGTEALGTAYFEIHSGFTNMASITSRTHFPYTLCSIHPTFTVQDWAKAEVIMEDFRVKTKTEAGCVYYGWTRVGDQVLTALKTAAALLPDAPSLFQYSMSHH